MRVPRLLPAMATLGLALSAGCTTEPENDGGLTGVDQRPLSSMPACSNYGSRPYMECNEMFYVGIKGGVATPTSAESSLVVSGVQEWAAAVFDGDFGVPQIAFTQNPSLVDIEVRFQQSGATEWCGSGYSDGAVGAVDLGITCGTGGSTAASLDYLILHELSELGVTGFTGSPSSQSVINAVCPSIDQKPNDFRPSIPCEWERQRVLDIANVRTSAPNWNSFLVDDLRLT